MTPANRMRSIADTLETRAMLCCRPSVLEMIELAAALRDIVRDCESAARPPSEPTFQAMIAAVRQNPGRPGDEPASRHVAPCGEPISERGNSLRTIDEAFRAADRHRAERHVVPFRPAPRGVRPCDGEPAA